MARSPGFGPLPYVHGATEWIAVLWVVASVAAVCIVLWRARRGRRPP